MDTTRFPTLHDQIDNKCWHGYSGYPCLASDLNTLTPLLDKLLFLEPASSISHRLYLSAQMHHSLQIEELIFIPPLPVHVTVGWRRIARRLMGSIRPQNPRCRVLGLTHRDRAVRAPRPQELHYSCRHEPSRECVRNR